MYRAIVVIIFHPCTNTFHVPFLKFDTYIDRNFGILLKIKNAFTVSSSQREIHMLKMVSDSVLVTLRDEMFYNW